MAHAATPNSEVDKTVTPASQKATSTVPDQIGDSSIAAEPERLGEDEDRQVLTWGLVDRDIHVHTTRDSHGPSDLAGGAQGQSAHALLPSKAGGCERAISTRPEVFPRSDMGGSTRTTRSPSTTRTAS